MPLYTPPAPSRELLIATGSIGTFRQRGIAIEGGLLNDYSLGVQNESRPLSTIKAGELITLNQGEHVRVKATVYDPNNGVVQLSVIAVNTDVSGNSAADLKPVTVKETEEERRKREEIDRIAAEEARAAEEAERANSAERSIKTAEEMAAETPAVTPEDAGYYEEPAPENVDSQQGYYSAPEVEPAGGPPSGTGSGPDPNDPYGSDAPYGPDIDQPGYADTFL